MSSLSATSVPSQFIELRTLDPSVQIEMRYAGSHNFVGERVAGYHAAKCFLVKPAARALVAAHQEFKSLGYALKVYDCYRPQRAVDHFVRWAKKIADIRMKAEFYPRVKKKNLFRQGYIASRSGHSRGSTVDLTLVPLPIQSQIPFKKGQVLLDCAQPLRFPDTSLDMGTGFDCFDTKSHTANAGTKTVKKNRQLLLRILKKHGFHNYAKEWWHFTFRPEPFPDTYFDFAIR